MEQSAVESVHFQRFVTFNQEPVFKSVAIHFTTARK